MSTKGHDSHQERGAPFHETVNFEARDINVSTVVKQLIYLAITIAIALAICVPILNFLTKVSAENDAPMPAVRTSVHMQDCSNLDAFPPEPRLQGVPCHENDPQQDLREKIAADEAANESAGWVDKANGIAKIPVKDAMEIIVQKSAGSAPREKK